jgi:hypothetical protein
MELTNEQFNLLNEKVFFILDGQKLSLSALYDLFTDNYQDCYYSAKSVEEEKEIEADKKRSIKELIALAEIAILRGKCSSFERGLECYRKVN